MERAQVHREGREQTEDLASTDVIPTAEGTQTGEAAAKVEEIDEVLASIDAVLEDNAEEFVRRYVQKGGQ